MPTELNEWHASGLLIVAALIIVLLARAILGA
jgi:hypothetical protein